MRYVKITYKCFSCGEVEWGFLEVQPGESWKRPTFINRITTLRKHFCTPEKVGFMHIQSAELVDENEKEVE